jgi:hypothetical protein
MHEALYSIFSMRLGGREEKERGKERGREKEGRERKRKQ